MILLFLLVLLLAIAWGLADSQLNAPIQRDVPPAVVVAKTAPAPPPAIAPPAVESPAAADAPLHAGDENLKKGLPGEPSQNQ